MVMKTLPFGDKKIVCWPRKGVSGPFFAYGTTAKVGEQLNETRVLEGSETLVRNDYGQKDELFRMRISELSIVNEFSSVKIGDHVVCLPSPYTISDFARRNFTLRNVMQAIVICGGGSVNLWNVRFDAAWGTFDVMSLPKDKVFKVLCLGVRVRVRVRVRMCFRHSELKFSVGMSLDIGLCLKWKRM